jgi:hypothetical protein
MPADGCENSEHQRISSQIPESSGVTDGREELPVPGRVVGSWWAHAVPTVQKGMYLRLRQTLDHVLPEVAESLFVEINLS